MKNVSIAQKRKLIEARKLVRKKFADFKRDLQQAEHSYFQEHKQVIEPLRDIAKKIENVHQVKVEPAEAAAIDESSSSSSTKKFLKKELKRQHDAEIPSSSSSLTLKGVVSSDDDDDDDDNDDDDKYKLAMDSNESATTTTRMIKEEEQPEINLPIASLPRYYAALLLLDKGNPNVDKSRYAMKYNNKLGTFRIGDSRIQLLQNDLVMKGEIYEGTEGLYNLLTLKSPPGNYSEKDVNNYCLIVINSNAHRHNYKNRGHLQPNKSFKYTNILGPFIKKSRSGKGLFKKVVVVVPNNNNKKNNKQVASSSSSSSPEYVYWNEPSELVARLKLLYASKWAGNNSHDNEILSITEELKEAGIIE